jgi:hypothetical protein
MGEMKINFYDKKTGKEAIVDGYLTVYGDGSVVELLCDDPYEQPWIVKERDDLYAKVIER